VIGELLLECGRFLVDELLEGIRLYPAGRKPVEHDMVDEQNEFTVPTELRLSPCDVVQVPRLSPQMLKGARSRFPDHA
jgi:hypothetical protein